MLFNSVPFLFGFFPVTVVVFFWLARASHGLAAGWLALASLFFYGWWNPAYVLLLANGRAGEVYNVCSGHPVAIREVLRQLITIAGVAVEIRDDPERARSTDLPILAGDATKLRAATGWSPQYALATSLRDIYMAAR